VLSFDTTPLWVSVPDVAGSSATAVAFVGGVVLALRYRHKANVRISADATRTATGRVVISARPIVDAIGPLRLHFASPDGATVSVTEVLETSSGTAEGACSKRSAFPGRQFVSQGEGLSSTRLFLVDTGKTDLVGWRVALSVTASGFLRDGLSWADLVFVPLPD
jgi:hypothetical protein